MVNAEAHYYFGAKHLWPKNCLYCFLGRLHWFLVLIPPRLCEEDTMSRGIRGAGTALSLHLRPGEILPGLLGSEVPQVMKRDCIFPAGCVPLLGQPEDTIYRDLQGAELRLGLGVGEWGYRSVSK